MKWRSAYLPLVAFGAIVAATALYSGRGGRDGEGQRNSYASREDCLKDYTEAECEPRRGGGFYGPLFFGRTAGLNDPGPGRTATEGRSQVASGTERGGFGATGRSYGGGYGG